MIIDLFARFPVKNKTLFTMSLPQRYSSAV